MYQLVDRPLSLISSPVVVTPAFVPRSQSVDDVFDISAGVAARVGLLNKGNRTFTINKSAVVIPTTKDAIGFFFANSVSLISPPDIYLIPVLRNSFLLVIARRYDEAIFI